MIKLMFGLSVSKEIKFVEINNMKPTSEEQENQPYGDEFKKELDERYEEYKNGGEFLTEEEMKARINSIIRKNDIK